MRGFSTRRSDEEEKRLSRQRYPLRIIFDLVVNSYSIELTASFGKKLSNLSLLKTIGNIFIDRTKATFYFILLFPCGDLIQLLEIPHC